MNRKVARSLMKRSGIVPDEASSGAEAIEKIRGKRYDIVFLDHMMPKMDGIETMDTLKREALLPADTAVIVKMQINIYKKILDYNTINNI